MFSGGDLRYEGASLHRVIFDNSIVDHESSYIGVVYHVGRGNDFAPCIETAPDCPPATSRRGLWDFVRRAAGKKPATPNSCKKPVPKKPTSQTPTSKKPNLGKPTAKRPMPEKPTGKLSAQ